MTMPMPGFDMGNHPPIPPTGMPPSSQMPASAPGAYQYTPLPTPAPAPATVPTPVLMLNAPMAPGNAPTQTPAMNAPMVTMNAPTQAPAMYQYPVPAPAPTQDDYTVQQWKAASAYHEYQAKRITVEAQQNNAYTQRALQAEAELRDANTDLVAKAARCNLVIGEKTALITKLQLQLKMQQELVTATEKSRVELQENVTAAEEHTTILQERLAKTEASCIRLMNETADHEKIVAALTHVEKPSRGSSQRPTAASPKKKQKPKKKKTAAASSASNTPTAPTDDEIMMNARRAFNGHMQYGDGPVEHREMEREIDALYKILIAKRDAKKATFDAKADHSFDHSNTFKGARAGFCFKTGPKGTGYYAEVNANVNIESEKYAETIAETESENEASHTPSTPSNSEGNADEFSEDGVDGHGPSQESHAQMLLRRDNEHWDRHGRPHPQSSFKVGSAPASSSSSSSSSSRKHSKKMARARSTRNSRKAALSSSSSTSSSKGEKQEASNSDDDNDDIVDMSV